MPGQLPRLLFIIDQPDSMALLLAHAVDQRLDILVARDAADGLSKAVAGIPDLILFETCVSDRNGLEVCRTLKQDARTQNIPVIILSTSDAIEDKLLGFSLGAVDYITKPCASDELLARVFVHLQARQRIDRLEAMVAKTALDRVGDQAFPDDQLFSRALAILDRRLSAPPGLIELARELGTNERKLTEIFRQRVGMTVFDYFSELRLEMARHLLEKSRMRVQAIAGQVGYRNAGDFTRAYRRRYGLSPREHRQTRGALVAGTD
jgi:DNA-binding response OmpR family regulator